MISKKLIAGAGALLLAASSQAAVIAYDDFPTDGDLNGSVGGSGFSTNWYDGMYTISAGVVSGTGNAFRGLDSTLGSNGTVWVSFDMVRTSGDSYGGLSFFEGGTERLILGDTYEKGVWGIAHAGSVNTDIPIDGDMKTAVAKITLGSGATSIVELWVGANNTDAVDCSGVADATVTAGNLENVDTLRIGAGFYIDFADLILADTAEEVGATLGDGTVYTAYAAGAWTNAANWSDGVPTATDAATIDTSADVTLDTSETIQSLSLKAAATLTIADGAGLTVTDDVECGAATLTFGIGAGSSGTLDVGGLLDISAVSLALDGSMDGDERVLATATGGLVGEFNNYADAAFVQSSDGVNYYIYYETNMVPNYIVINTNGVQSGGEIVLPPRPTEDPVVSGYDQRYMAYDYDVSTGVWTDMVSVAQNATAVNLPDFTVTTNAPNGRPAVENSGILAAGTAMNFTRNAAVATNGFTIQAVIRIDEDTDSDSRRGPFACDEATGWSGLYMGAQAANSSQIRAGNIGDTRNGTYVLAGSTVNTLDVGTWGIYTLVVDPETTPQMTATFDLLSDGSTAFTITGTVPTTTNWVGGISASGRLFGGDMGGSADGDTDNWKGAIADLVVYDHVLDSAELAANEAAFQTLYLDDIVYPEYIGDVAVEALSSTEMVVTWETSQWNTYALEETTSLTVPSWGDVETGIPGTGGDVSVTTTVSEASTFYRAYIVD